MKMCRHLEFPVPIVEGEVFNSLLESQELVCCSNSMKTFLWSCTVVFLNDKWRKLKTQLSCSITLMYMYMYWLCIQELDLYFWLCSINTWKRNMDIKYKPSIIRYWHRSLNPRKLIAVKFSHLTRNMTMQRTLKLFKLPDVSSLH